jgi:hypothetical protein
VSSPGVSSTDVLLPAKALHKYTERKCLLPSCSATNNIDGVENIARAEIKRFDDPRVIAAIPIAKARWTSR